jgi:hypothetical protein
MELQVLPRSIVDCDSFIPVHYNQPGCSHLIVNDRLRRQRMTTPPQYSPIFDTNAPPETARRWQLLLAATILLAVAVRVWAATQWPANFQSDEAVFGLMARHILAGEFTPTLYGPAYLGSIESILSAGFMSIFGTSVMAFRMSALVLFALFFVLHAIFTSRYFGYPVALVSLLFLSVPGFHVLEWTYQPVGAYGAMFVIGTLMLLVALPDRSEPRAMTLRAALMGVLAGLGLWANNTMLLYLVAIGAVAFLSSPEWRMIHARLSEFSTRVVHIPLAEWLPVAMIGTFGLGVLAFFSAACSPEGLFITISSIAKAILFVLGIGLAGSAIVLSQRRRQLALETGAIGAGFAAGYAPLLYQWVAKGVSPYWAVYPSCPEGAVSRARLLVKEILPALWGMPAIDQLKQSAPATLVMWIAILGLAVAAVGLFFWWNRLIAWRTFAGSPLDEDWRPVGTLVLLFAIPIVITILAGNTVDLYSIRHALMLAQVSAIIFAFLVVWLSVRFRRIGMIVGAFWLLVVGSTNLIRASTDWLVKFTRYDPNQVATLARYLEDNDIEVGYADYWGAYTLDFLLQEKTILAPFNGIDRYLPYSDAAYSARRLVYIFPATNAPLPTGKMEDLRAFLSDADNLKGEGAARKKIKERLAAQDALGMQHVAAWDVWIVVDK